jgi:hypothetical protein
MDNVTLILILAMNFLLVIILGVFGFFIYRLLKNQQPNLNAQPETKKLNEAEFHPEILNRLKLVEKVKPKRRELFCPNHPDEPGEANCGVCDQLYCSTCIRPFKSMHLCKEHLALVMNNEWDEVLTLKTSTKDPEQGVKLYDIKKKIFKEEHIPIYIETHYKINVDQDYVETYLVLFALKAEVADVKNKLIEFQTLL